MVNLTRIYTRTGDDGTTSLGDMSRTSKNDPRLRAFADVDEANSAIGAALALGALSEDIRAVLGMVQNDLFDVGSDLSRPVSDDEASQKDRIDEAYISRLEAACDEYNSQLEPLRSFILPGGSAGAALLHVARTIVRRAERATWAAHAAFGDGVNIQTATYLNRLSDLLFILARVANLPSGDVLWEPGKNR